MKCYPAFVGIVILLLAVLACRPVFAIGWTELIILLVVIAILLGPILLKVYRAVDKIRKADDSEGKKK